MENFAKCFELLEDPRTGNASFHNLLEILMISLCAVLCGCETAVDMSEFGLAKERFLRQFLKLKHGIPSHDTFSRIFQLIDPKQFQICFSAFAGRFSEACKGVIAKGITTTSTEIAYYRLSSPLSAGRLGEVARAHWGNKNGLHWVLDVVLNEDQNRTRKDHGPKNLAVLRHMALNIVRKETSILPIVAPFKVDFLEKKMSYTAATSCLHYPPAKELNFNVKIRTFMLLTAKKMSRPKAPPLESARGDKPPLDSPALRPSGRLSGGCRSADRPLADLQDSGQRQQHATR